MTRIRARTVSVGDERVAVLAAELPGKLAPERPHLGPVVLLVDRARRDLVADEDSDLRRRRRLETGLREHLLNPRELRGRVTAREVVERDQRVGLAAAEVRLHLDDRIAAFAAQAADGIQQQVPHAFGDERSAEELGRVVVLGHRFVAPDLMEVGGELRLLVAAGGDVRVRSYDVPPRLQTGDRLALGRCARLTLAHVPLLLRETGTEQLLSHLLDLARVLAGVARVEEQLRGVERAVSLVGGEGLVVGPTVANLHQLADPAPLAVAEDIAEAAVAPEMDHRLEQEVAIGPRALRDASVPVDCQRPVVTELLRELRVDEWPDPLGDELDRTLDSLVVGHGHERLHLQSLLRFRLRGTSNTASDLGPGDDERVVRQRLLCPSLPLTDGVQPVGQLTCLFAVACT